MMLSTTPLNTVETVEAGDEEEEMAKRVYYRIHSPGSRPGYCGTAVDMSSWKAGAFHFRMVVEDQRPVPDHRYGQNGRGWLRG